MILPERKRTLALGNNISKCILFVVLFHTFQYSSIFPVTLEMIINFVNFWTDRTVDFMFYGPGFFSSFQLGEHVWFADFIPH